MSNPLVLLVHGVNSTGEWHETTVTECHGLFQCIPIKYRYYHGLTGPFKVYVWPTALALMAAIGALLYFDTSRERLAVILPVLVVTGIIVMWAEWEWNRRISSLLVPLLYSV